MWLSASRSLIFWNISSRPKQRTLVWDPVLEALHLIKCSQASWELTLTIQTGLLRRRQVLRPWRRGLRLPLIILFVTLTLQPNNISHFQLNHLTTHIPNVAVHRYVLLLLVGGSHSSRKAPGFWTKSKEKGLHLRVTIKKKTGNSRSRSIGYREMRNVASWRCTMRSRLLPTEGGAAVSFLNSDYY